MRFWRRATGIPRHLAILASAFHPPTRAHLALAEAALANGADEVLFVLPEVLPHKQYDGVGFEQRLELVLEATATEPRYSVAASGGGLFREIAGECRDYYAARLAFLCGRDAAERITGWDYGAGPSIEEQLGGFELWVAPRAGTFSAPPALGHAVRNLPIEDGFDEVSATEVRRRIAAGEPWRQLVPGEIAGKIHAFYAT